MLIKFYLKYATGNDVAAVRSALSDVGDEPAPLTTLASPAEEFAQARRRLRIMQHLAATGANDGLFTLVSAELEINGAATTDSGIDIDTHIDLDFSGVPTDSAETVTLGGSSNTINVGDIVRVDELSMKISGGFGSVELGANDGAEDIFKITGASVAAGTGGIDGDHHQVNGGIQGASAGGGGSAGRRRFG